MSLKNSNTLNYNEEIERGEYPRGLEERMIERVGGGNGGGCRGRDYILRGLEKGMSQMSRDGNS